MFRNNHKTAILERQPSILKRLTHGLILATIGFTILWGTVNFVKATPSKGSVQGTTPSKGSVQGTTYIDSNENGIFDDGEKGLAGVTVNAYDGSNHILATALSDSDGKYTLAVAEGGRVRVEFDFIPSGYISTRFGEDHLTTVVFLDAGGSIDLPMGFTKRPAKEYEIGNRVWYKSTKLATAFGMMKMAMGCKTQVNPQFPMFMSDSMRLDTTFQALNIHFVLLKPLPMPMGNICSMTQWLSWVFCLGNAMTFA